MQQTQHYDRGVVTRAKESLKSLEVDHSMQDWTPAAMTKLGSLKNLKRLSFSFNPDPNLKYVGRVCGYGPAYVNVTDSGIRRLVSSAKKLKHLSLRAPQMTKYLVKRLRIEYPDLDLRINNY